MSLSKSEEELMGHLWRQGSAGMKELMACYTRPKPAPTTVATLLKRMYDKGYIKYSKEGKSRIYYPVIKKQKYFGKKINHLIGNFFNGSKTQFASFFAEEGNLTETELKELRKIIDQKIKKGK